MVGAAALCMELQVSYFLPISAMLQKHSLLYVLHVCLFRYPFFFCSSLSALLILTLSFPPGFLTLFPCMHSSLYWLHYSAIRIN